MTHSPEHARQRIRVEKRTIIALPTSAEMTELWNFRELVIVLARRDISSRYRQAILGGLWAILQPVVHVGLLSLFLGRFARVPSEGVPYFIFALSGMILWQYLSGAISSSMMHLGTTSVLIKKVYFPRLVLPASATLPSLLDLCVNLVLTLLVVVLCYQHNPIPQIFWLPLFILLAIVTAFGAICWFQSLTILFFDMHHIIPFAMQLWLVCSPVMYPVSIIPESYRVYYWLNPMSTAIAGTRWCLLNVGEQPSFPQLLSVLTAFFLCFTGALFYMRVSKWFADLV